MEQVENPGLLTTLEHQNHTRCLYPASHGLDTKTQTPPFPTLQPHIDEGLATRCKLHSPITPQQPPRPPHPCQHNKSISKCKPSPPSTKVSCYTQPPPSNITTSSLPRAANKETSLLPSSILASPPKAGSAPCSNTQLRDGASYVALMRHPRILAYVRSPVHSL